MGGGGFVLLKVARSRPITAKQVEIRLAKLLKILRIGTSGWRFSCVRFLRDMTNLPKSLALLSGLRFWYKESSQLTTTKG
jgi:hypothetical protein